MNIKSMIAIVLIIAGIVILAYSGLSFTTAGKPVDVLGLKIATTERHFIPPMVGVVCAVIGGILLIVPPRGFTVKGNG